MSDARSVVVRLSMENSQYLAKAQQTGAATEASMGRVDKSTKKASIGLTQVEKAGAAAAVVLAGKAVLAAADFDQAMSSVEAATHGTAAEMGSLREAALDAGKATKFSATEAAAGIENLAKAGVSTSDILGGALTGSLDLAAAGQLSVADAAEYTATALTQFQLGGEQAAHVADLLAAGAGKAQGEVSDMALALTYAGVPAANLGVTIEETAGSIALLAKNGIIGEKAGTALRGMLGSIGSPSKIAAKEMQRLGLEVFDAQGNFVGFEGVAGQLQERLKNLTQEEREQALGRIFGNEQAAAAGVFFREGAAGVAEMTAAVNDQGYAAETASIKMDNLKGDVEVLMGSIETALIGSGDSSQSTLRTTTQLLTELVDVMNEAQTGDSALSEGIRGATDQLSLINSGPAKMGLDNLKKVSDALFGKDEATKDAADSATDAADADALLAAETTRLAQASTRTAEASRLSTEELEAQAEALADARKAASETAGSFFDLGDSLNDAKVSLGDWISQMANQADALNNFTSNAKKAADNGLRKGLIAALKEAGPEGALRMKQLANATQGEIDRANAAWAKGQKAINRYIDATVKVPKTVSTTVKVDDRPAFASFRAIDQYMTDLDGRRATTYVDTVRTMTDRRGGAAFSQKATGGPILGPGTGTSDDVPIMASNGEHMWTAREVANAGGHGAVERIRSEFRFAGGGAIENASKKERERREEQRRREEERRQRQLDAQRAKDLLASDLRDEQQQEALELRDAQRRLKSARGAGRPKAEIRDAQLAVQQGRANRDDSRDQRAQDREDERIRIAQDAEDERIRIAEEEARKQEEIADAVLAGQQRAWDTATDAAKSQVDASQALVDSVESSMDRIGAAATAAFRGDLFDPKSQTQMRGLWSGADAASGGGWRERGMEDIAGLQERKGLIAQLKDAGLSGGALEALLGQSDNAGIADLLAKGEVADYAALFKQREELLGQVGTDAGVAGYGADLASASTQLAESNQHLQRIEEAIKAARPITILQTTTEAAAAAELARLLGNF